MDSDNSQDQFKQIMTSLNNPAPRAQIHRAPTPFPVVQADNQMEGIKIALHQMLQLNINEMEKGVHNILEEPISQISILNSKLLDLEKLNQQLHLENRRMREENQTSQKEKNLKEQENFELQQKLRHSEAQVRTLQEKENSIVLEKKSRDRSFASHIITYVFRD